MNDSEPPKGVQAAEELAKLRAQLQQEEAVVDQLRSKLQRSASPSEGSRPPAATVGRGSPARADWQHLDHRQPQSSADEQQPSAKPNLDFAGRERSRRHQVIAERCRWLYLKGRLENFEVLRPQSVFPEDLVSALQSAPGTNAAALVAPQADMKRQLDLLYSELHRRNVETPSSQSATGGGKAAAAVAGAPEVSPEVSARSEPPKSPGDDTIHL
mmetsp:Transcript_119093/g.210572  ORF Transcript_119093/g.210572 Transcript_119093/m.210572 type:complete len:214 (-) Transcript_119093:22-663(-)